MVQEKFSLHLFLKSRFKTHCNLTPNIHFPFQQLPNKTDDHKNGGSSKAQCYSCGTEYTLKPLDIPNLCKSLCSVNTKPN